MVLPFSGHLLARFCSCAFSAVLQAQSHVLPARGISRAHLLRCCAIVASGCGISLIGWDCACDRSGDLRPLSGFICLLCLRSSALNLPSLLRMLSTATGLSSNGGTRCARPSCIGSREVPITKNSLSLE